MLHRATVLLLMASCASTALAGETVVAGQAHPIQSEVLHEARTYRVQLPESYTWATDRRYPVLYVLDGKSHFLHTSGSIGYLSAHGEIPEMIVVALDSTVRIRDFTQTDWPSAWIGGGGAANFRRFLSTELIPAVDRAYRTDGFRILSGHSAGGQFVLYCLTSEPSLFQAYVALSPSLDWDDRLPQRSLDAFLRATRVLKAFLYVARSDDSGQALADYEKLVGTLEATSPEGFRWHSRPFPEETHGSIPLVAQIDALRHVYQGYRFHGDMLGGGFDVAQRHFQEVSKRVGWPLSVPEGVINDLGYAALSEGKFQDALALFKRNVEANPNSANAYDSLAEACAKAGLWKDAADASDRAATLATDHDIVNRAYFVEQAKKIRERLELESAKSR